MGTLLFGKQVKYWVTWCIVLPGYIQEPKFENPHLWECVATLHCTLVHQCLASNIQQWTGFSTQVLTCATITAASCFCEPFCAYLQLCTPLQNRYISGHARIPQVSSC